MMFLGECPARSKRHVDGNPTFLELALIQLWSVHDLVAAWERWEREQPKKAALECPASTDGRNASPNRLVFLSVIITYQERTV